MGCQEDIMDIFVERERESVAIAKSDGHVVIKFCGVGILELTMPSFEWFNF